MRINDDRRPRVVILLVLVASLCATAVFSASADAVTEGAGWELTAHTYPTYFPPGGRGTIGINVFNIGAAASKGTITLTDTLPPGVTAVEAGSLRLHENGVSPVIEHRLWYCSGDGPDGDVKGATTVTCTNEGPSGFEGLAEFPGGGGAPWASQSRDPVPHERHPQPRVGIAVEAGAPASGLVNRVTIAGGGAPSPASTQNPVTISSSKPPFSFTGWQVWFSNADGTIDTQAGSHPYEATFTFALAGALNATKTSLLPAGGSVRNIEVQLPPGFVGNPTAVPECTRQQLVAGISFGRGCPQASEVGVNTTYFAELGELGFEVFNMVPPPGVAAQFAFNFGGILVFLNAGVRSGSDYGITVHADQTPQREIMENTFILWDVPGEHSHNLWRGGEVGGCSSEQIEHSRVNSNTENNCAEPQNPPQRPLLTLPTACGAPQPFSIRANTWQNEQLYAGDSFVSQDPNGVPTGFTGCENDAFAPLISTSPDTAKADTPAGLTVEVKPPVGGLEDPNGLGTSDIQNTKVTLPEGFVINPGQAAGLQACQQGDVEGGDDLPLPGEDGREPRFDGPAKCPNASKVGTVTIKSPLIEGAPEKQFEGNVYVLQSNPPELKLLVAASADGVNLKLVGVVHLDEHTGRLTTTFEGTPALPFTDFKLSFSGGAQAALDTPTQCGFYETSADFTPWGSPFVQDFLTNASFSLTEGPDGSACPSSPLPFSPTLTAGATTDQAGGFTDFSMLLARGDGQQRIERLQFRAPAGLGGMLSAVPLCGEPQAAQGTCSSVSRIGRASVASGPGPYPLVLPQPGEPELPIYLTGPYGGAPFGLSIVTPVLAGPFDLGTIVTRAKIEIDPHTAQVTVTTDSLPQVVAGVPTDLRLVDAVIDRPGFMFNPTNCDPSSFSGTAWGTPPAGMGGPGASASIGSHFQVGSCRGLEFHPKFSVSASGRNSKANGASLTARVSYPSAAQGTQANIGLVKVELPKQLPSRLTTLQKACTLAQFESNPAGCPPASFIGHAIVHTPELPDPLTGPAIFVSHGGEAFPTLTMVLQGDGVTIDLVGSTFINKAGITSTTFKTVPDAPFSTFELTLPQGPSSALATNVPAKANYSLCGQKLTMPTEFVGQNGAVLNQTTPVNVTGCAKTKTLTRAQKLAAALKACHKKKARARRVSCERQARQRYGAVKKKKKKK